MLALHFLPNRDYDIFVDATVDPTLIGSEPSFEQINLPDQTTGLESNIFDDNSDLNLLPELNSNLFLADDVNLDQVTGSSIVLADDDSCDLSIADDTQLFGKVRREASCWASPAGQARQPKRPKNNDDFSSFRFFYTNVKVSDLSEAMCPSDIFGTSILPVCLNIHNGHIIPVPGQLWSDLQDVSRTPENDLY